MIQKAQKKLLAEAGYPDGFETRLDWTMGGGGDVNTRADAEWLQRDLGRIGIRAKIELLIMEHTGICLPKVHEKVLAACKFLGEKQAFSGLT